LPCCRMWHVAIPSRFTMCLFALAWSGLGCATMHSSLSKGNLSFYSVGASTQTWRQLCLGRASHNLWPALSTGLLRRTSSSLRWCYTPEQWTSTWPRCTSPIHHSWHECSLEGLEYLSSPTCTFVHCSLSTTQPPVYCVSMS
jgi:hypothetical protein